MSLYGSQQGYSRVQKCKNFEKCCCTDLNCGFLHTYRYCFKYQNTTCKEKKCPYIHCTSLEQYRYEMTGKATENLKREVGRTLQNTDICGDFKKNICVRKVCKRRHFNLYDMQPLECPICREEYTVNSLGATICGHVFCYNCALKCIDFHISEEGYINVDCPICRFESTYRKLS